MKKIMISLMFACCLSAAYSQQITIDSKDYNKIFSENDSLKERIKDCDNQIAAWKKLLAEKEKNLADANKKIANADKKIDDLNKNKVKIERDSLQNQVGALKANIETLRGELSGKDRQIAGIQTESKIKIREAEERGKAEILSKALGVYKKPFDELIKSSSRQSAERDLLLAGNDAAARKTLRNLQSYFAARQVLTERYSEQAVTAAQKQISALEQTELVKELAVQLEDYGLFNDGLKDVINEIIEIDRQFTANSATAQKAKMQEISHAISKYFYDYYSFSFGNYPCLAGVILEICRRKHKHADTDIKDLLNKL